MILNNQRKKKICLDKKIHKYSIYFIGKFVVVLLLFVTTVAFVNDAKKFDVNCDASALISIAETLISGPTKENKRKLFY